jgi:hypothetical protein
MSIMDEDNSENPRSLHWKVVPRPKSSSNRGTAMTRTPPTPPPAPSPFPFSPQEALDFMQKMWNPLGVPIPGFPLPGTGAPGAVPFPNPAAMFATLDPAELERKIGEMKVVEAWLAMSLNLMQMSIKTMEMQKASLEALRGAQAAAAAGAEHHRRKP